MRGPDYTGWVAYNPTSSETTTTSMWKQTKVEKDSYGHDCYTWELYSSQVAYGPSKQGTEKEENNVYETDINVHTHNGEENNRWFIYKGIE